jgi:ABC-2 type transport system permease protein
MPLRVELGRQWARRRTRLTLGFLVVLPFLLVGAFELGNGSNRRGAPGFVDLATDGAANFTLFTLFAATGFLLVVVFALFSGDTVAGEASWSSLRYLLAAPVPRSHLLRQKLLVALMLSLFALVLLPAVAYLAGGLFFGWAPARTPLGTTFSTGESLARLGLVLVYLAVTLLFVSALAFLLGVWTDAPLGAVGGAVLLVIVSNILDAVTALGDWRQVLPTHYQYAWTDLLGPTLVWDQVARGVLWSLAYSLVLYAAAWWHFLRKDVLS